MASTFHDMLSSQPYPLYFQLRRNHQQSLLLNGMTKQICIQKKRALKYPDKLETSLAGTTLECYNQNSIYLLLFNIVVLQKKYLCVTVVSCVSLNIHMMMGQLLQYGPKRRERLINKIEIMCNFINSSHWGGFIWLSFFKNITCLQNWAIATSLYTATRILTFSCY